MGLFYVLITIMGISCLQMYFVGYITLLFINNDTWIFSKLCLTSIKHTRGGSQRARARLENLARFALGTVLIDLDGMGGVLSHNHKPGRP